MTGPPHTPGSGGQDPSGGPQQRAEGPDRHRQPPGTEPVTARSPLRLRAVMSAIALVASVVAAVLFVLIARRDGGTGAWLAAAICAVLVPISLADLIVLARRVRR